MRKEDNSVNEEISVEGVHCPDCAVKIERNISKIDGVERASVDAGRGKIQVSYDPADVENQVYVRNHLWLDGRSVQ